MVISKNDNAPGDLAFGTQNNFNQYPLKSDAAGKVVVTLFPGNIPGPVKIKAALKDNPSIFALSKNIAIATGRASQEKFSLTANSVAITATTNVINAVTTTPATGTTPATSTVLASIPIAVTLTDRMSNPVPEGTVVRLLLQKMERLVPTV